MAGGGKRRPKWKGARGGQGASSDSEVQEAVVRQQRRGGPGAADRPLLEHEGGAVPGREGPGSPHGTGWAAQVSVFLLLFISQ